MPTRILIVEDERITAEDLCDTLAELGYSVTAAVANGADAIAHAERDRPDLALMDIHIPGELDGTAAALVLRQRFNIPVIYLTAHVDDATVARAKQAGPLGYVTKPFQASSLHASIEIALERHRQERKAVERDGVLASTLQAVSAGVLSAVVSLDVSGRITLFNRSAEIWTGWSARDAVDQAIGGIVRLVARATEEPLTPWERALSDGVLQELPADAMLISPQGERRPVSGSAAPVRGHTGAVAGAVLVFRNAEHPDQPANVTSAAPGRHDGIDLGNFKIIAASPAMKQVLGFARRVAQSEVSTILLEGESGTGKDVLAQFLHFYGRRREGPFVTLNCAAIPETLLESELFGYEKGAFTDARMPKAGILEIAHGGTIFLDEIGEMPLPVQAKLLRVLEEQVFRRLGGLRDIQVDVRVVAATNRKLADAIEEGRFRLDLYYRLNVIQIVLPALRDRKEDILPLTEHFIRIYNERFKRDIQGITHGAAATLVSHGWPGNVRELRNVVERAMILEESERIQSTSLQLNPGRAGDVTPAAAAEVEPAFQASLEQTEKNLVARALEKAGGNQTRAAVLLGISRDTLRYRMKKFNLR